MTKRPRRLVQWGAGNIGRSFIGQIFARGGWEVVFVDINRDLVQALAAARSYEVIEISSSGECVKNIRGVTAITPDMNQKLLAAIADAEILSFSVGKNILPLVVPRAAEAVMYRYQQRPDSPLDILIAENISDGALTLRRLFTEALPPGFPVRQYLGFVETSLGKMVPIQPDGHPLKVWAEPFNTLILDRKGFRGALPDCPDIRPVEPIRAYVAEKLYIHNLGHASSAYLGYQKDPVSRFIWQHMGTGVRKEVKSAMMQAGAVLRAEFPGVFSEKEIECHIEDLLSRFANKALGDTVYRVGRDLKRKLHKEDRLMGAILLACRHALPWDAIGKVYKAAFSFFAADEDGRQYPEDIVFLKNAKEMGAQKIFSYAAGFTESEVEKYTNTILRSLEKI